MVSLIKEIKEQSPCVKIAISSVLTRKDNESLQCQVLQVNRTLKSCCESMNCDFLYNDNFNAECLNRDGLHLNPKGVFTLDSNFKQFINEI